METQNMNAATQSFQSMFNAQGYQNVFKTWATINERVASILIDTGTRSVDIMSDKTKEALTNLREVTQVRDDVTDYGKAYSEFAQKQINLLKTTAQEVGELTREAGTRTQQLASDAGEDVSEKATTELSQAAEKVAYKAESVLDKVASDVAANVAKPTPSVKKNA